MQAGEASVRLLLILEVSRKRLLADSAETMRNGEIL